MRRRRLGRYRPRRGRRYGQRQEGNESLQLVIDNQRLSVAQYILHGIDVHAAQRDVLGELVGREHAIEALRLAGRLSDGGLFDTLRLGRDPRCLTTRPRDDIVMERLRLVAHAVSVGVGALYVTKAFDHGGRRIDLLELYLGNLDANVVAIEDLLSLRQDIGFDLGAQLRQRWLDGRAADHFSHGAFSHTTNQCFRLAGVEQETRSTALTHANTPEDRDVDVDNVFVAGQHQAFGQHVAPAGVAPRLHPAARARAEADFGAVDPCDGRLFDPLDRPWQMPVQTGRGPVGVGAEPQDNALLVRLDTIDAAAQPEHDQGKGKDRQATAAGEIAAKSAPAKTAAAQHSADEGLRLSNKLIQIGRPAAEWSARPPTGTAAGTAWLIIVIAATPRSARGWAAGWRTAGRWLTATAWTASAGRAARRSPWAWAAIVPGHLVSITPDYVQIWRRPLAILCHTPYGGDRRGGRLLIGRQQRVCKGMTTVSPAALRDALRAIKDPASGRDIVAAGLVEGIEVRDGLVQASLLTDRAQAAAMEPVRREVERVLGLQPGVTNATAVLTAHKPGARPAPPPQPRGHDHGGAGHGGAGHGGTGPGKAPMLLPDVKAIVAVASGKGGVGKSTVAVNMAVSLARQGLKVGLLDADIYGPSLPRMLGLNRKPEVRADKMIPLSAWGLACMSIGFLVDEETPMIWRGPMVMGALEQMMGQVTWGALDILVVDMPPGTGDAQLTMAQRVALTGAVIVSTPQDIALIDARRGVRMFEKTRVPVLGLVENMSFFCCPNCGHRSDIFGHGGARAEADRLGAEFLGEIPLLLDIRTASDAGTPIAASAPNSEAAKAYAALARRVWEKVGGAAVARGTGPRIVIE